MQYSYQERKGASTVGCELYLWADYWETENNLPVKPWSTEQCRSLNPGVSTDWLLTLKRSLLKLMFRKEKKKCTFCNSMNFRTGWCGNHPMRFIKLCLTVCVYDRALNSWNLVSSSESNSQSFRRRGVINLMDEKGLGLILCCWTWSRLSTLCQFWSGKTKHNSVAFQAPASVLSLALLDGVRLA